VLLAAVLSLSRAQLYARLRDPWPEWKDDNRWWITPMPDRLRPEASMPVPPGPR